MYYVAIITAASARTKRFGRLPFFILLFLCGSRYSVQPPHTTIVHVNTIVESAIQHTDTSTDIAHSLIIAFSNTYNSRIPQNGSRAYTFLFRMFAPRVCLTTARA